MKYVYLDASSGVSGDMCLGALLDLGVDPALFKEKMAGLRLPVEIAVRRVRRGGFAALKVDVEIKGHEQHERNFADVERVILKSRLAPAVKDRALAIFTRLFEAEAKVHGRKFKEAHLHEAGRRRRPGRHRRDGLPSRGAGRRGRLLLAAQRRLGLGQDLARPPGRAAPGRGRAPEEGPRLRGLGRIGAGHADRGGHRRDAGQALPQAPRARVREDRPGRRDPRNSPRSRTSCGSITATPRPSTRPEERLHRRGDDRRRHAAAPGPLPGAGPRGGRPRRHPLPRRHEEEPAGDQALPARRVGSDGRPDRGRVPGDDVDRRALLSGRPARPRPRDPGPSASAARRSGIKVAALGGRTVNVQPEYEDLLKAARKTGRPLKEIAHAAVCEFARKR